jgi:ABC-type Zn2+ transport system substrate-binding protein/surface adhesin
MPRVFFRFLAVVLLALAVPLQGMAAVTAGQCMALGHHQDGAGQENHGHGQNGADGHDHASHSHSDEGGAKHGDEGGNNPHCGPCTACCASASIAGSVGLSIPSSPTNAKYVFSQLPPFGFQPDGLDRPPLAL